MAKVNYKTWGPLAVKPGSKKTKYFFGSNAIDITIQDRLTFDSYVSFDMELIERCCPAGVPMPEMVDFIYGWMLLKYYTNFDTDLSTEHMWSLCQNKEFISFVESEIKDDVRTVRDSVFEYIKALRINQNNNTNLETLAGNLNVLIEQVMGSIDLNNVLASASESDASESDDIDNGVKENVVQFPSTDEADET